jgi:dephospho-CoA kinase
MPIVVGMTGGIGSGKTTAADAFAELGVEVIDTDELARRLTAPGEPAVRGIAARFGEDVLDARGALDRARLRQKVFSDPHERQRLEALLHPLIRDEVARLLALAQGPYVLLVVPLLIEAGGYAGVVDRVLVVDCPPEMQIERAMRRSGLAREEVESIMRTQAPRSERLARADDVLMNDSDLRALREKVAQLHHAYLSLSGTGATQ